jgi:hypothetical protein
MFVLKTLRPGVPPGEEEEDCHPSDRLSVMSEASERYARQQRTKIAEMIGEDLMEEFVSVARDTTCVSPEDVAMLMTITYQRGFDDGGRFTRSPG